jgi:AraC-like DNA-binding protein
MEPVLKFLCPPVPYIIDCGTFVYRIGDQHLQRKNYGIFDFIYVEQGKLFLGEDDRHWAVQEGEALLLRPDLNHYPTQPCQEETVIYWVHFQTFGSWGEFGGLEEAHDHQQEIRLKVEHERMTYLDPLDITRILVKKYSALSATAVEYIKKLVCLTQDPPQLVTWKKQSIFQELLQSMDEGENFIQDVAAIKVAEKIEQYLQAHYAQPITNAVLQEALNYHPNYMARCMQKVYGYTPMQYLTYLRLEEAKKMLINTNDSVARIAALTGFNESSYFSALFSRTEGISPLNFRKKYMHQYHQR